MNTQKKLILSSGGMVKTADGKNWESRKKWEIGYRLKNKTRLAKYARDRYNQRNGDVYDKAKRATYMKRWRKNNRVLKNNSNRTRRAVKRNSKNGEKRLMISWEKAWRSKPKVRCYWCASMFSPKECHVDHIVALNHKGPHEIGNLCISCSTCNLKKNQKTLHYWNAQIEQPVLF